MIDKLMRKLKKANKDDRQQKIVNSIYGFAIGDAVGVPYEFCRKGSFKCSDMDSCTDTSFHQVPKGTWSDDTSLMLCVLNAIKKEGDHDKISSWERNAIDWLKYGEYSCTNPPFDIGMACHRGINSMILKEKNVAADAENSNGNGGLMRVLPIAFSKDLTPKRALELCRIFNSCSHNHEISYVGCLIYVLFVNKLINANERVSKELFKEFLAKACAETKGLIWSDEYNRIDNGTILFCREEEVKSTGYVVYTLESAIRSAYIGNDFRDCILKAVNLGEDTDTIAALAGGIAGIMYGVDERWKKSLKCKEVIEESIEYFLS